MQLYTHEEDLLKTITTNSTTYTNTYGDFGLKQSVKAGEHTLASYTYDVAGKSFLLTELSYGNGNSVAYEYDDLDRIIAVRYDGETNPSVEYLYDNMGSATLRKDNITQVQTKQLYDFADRLCRIEEKGMGSNALDHAYEWTYDQRDNVASITETLNGASWEIAFAYNADDILTQATYGTNAFANAFDTLGRQTQRTHTVSGSTRMTTTYGYINPDSTHTTTLLSTVRNQGTQFDKTTAYTYDDHGNITSVTANGSTTTYAYDNLGQLTRENNQAAGKTWTWTYDTAGNILSKSEYAYTTGSLGTALDTITYGYADSRGWGDLLTSYDGRSFQYDEIGNLLSDGEWTYTWSKGRQLVSMTKPGSTLTFTYDADGNRTSKTVNGVTTNYTYVDGRVTHETNGTDTIHYRYDTNGTLLSMNLNGTEYYYLYNGQRDVIGLYDASGNVVAEYIYDAWGRLLTITGSLASIVGAKNRYRYRSYHYDTETRFYYGSSRYYDPEVGRWINADNAIAGVGGDIRGYSLFPYCMNNPVNMSDHSGHWPQRLKKAASAAVKKVKKADTAAVKTAKKAVTVVVKTDKSAVSSPTNIVKASSKSLPIKGDPGSSQTLPNPDGTPKQRRWYGPDGNPVRDRDYNHPGNMPFPHDHKWENGKRGEEHLPPDPSYKMNWEPVIGVGLVSICVVGIIAVAADDATGVGVVDDFLYGPLGAGVGEGLIMIFQ